MSKTRDASDAVAGIVPAAGRSERMGTPKPLLEVDGQTFVARAVQLLRQGGCSPVVVVVAAADEATREAAETAGARVVENAAAHSEQVDSVRLALAALPDAPAALILPVDVPYVSATTVAAVVAAWQRGGAAIVLPEHDGVGGHPVLLDRTLFAALMETPQPEGVRSLLTVHAADVETVAVDDAGALLDLDTPADLHRHGGTA
ncbi:MAG: NTP transferase domain-containing protein [Gemmatimonadota bacterium]